MNKTCRDLKLLLLYTALAIVTGCADGVPVGNSDAGGDGGALPSCVANNYTAQPTYNGIRVVPDDGDKVCATRANPGDGPVNPGIKGALDNAAYAHSAVFGVHHLPTFSSIDGVNIVYGGVPAITFDTAVIQLPAGTFDAATAYGAALGNNIWYYAYVYLSGNTIFSLVSTQGPDEFLRYRTGNTSRAYLGCFKTDGSAVIRPFYAVHGRYTYTLPIGILSTSAVANAYTDQSLAAGMPPHARVASIRVAAAPDGGTDTLSIQPKGITASGYSASATYQQTINTYSSGLYWNVEVPTDSSNVIRYKMATGGGASTLAIDVTGFNE